jgi:prefoldin subunit 5
MSIASIIALILIFVVGIPSFKIIKETLDRARLLEDQLLAINSQLRDMEFKLEELDEKLDSPSASLAKRTQQEEEVFHH